MKPTIPTTIACAFIWTFGIALPSYAGNTCEVQSGSATAALVELYTSEGCSSCPPADRRLNQLQQQLRSSRGPEAVVVPLALHVTYWNDLGWKDGLSQKIFDDRQGALVAKSASRGKSGVVYTPQFFVNGAELRGWRDALQQQIRKINAMPAPLTIALKTKPAGSDRVVVDASVNAQDAKVDGALYLAISENGLVSQVGSGENSGATLKHDDAARAWFGPVQLEQGKGCLQQTITIPPSWNRQHLQAVAFVQDRRDGRILQAVSTQQCTSTRGL